MRRLESTDLLALWERGSVRHALDRCALLAAWARPDLPPERIPELPLGQITESLLRFRAESFGPRIRAHVDCEACGERLELQFTADELLQPVTAVPGEVEVQGLRCRVPSLCDLAAVACEHDTAVAVRRLLARCRLDAHDPSSESAPVPADTLRALEAALEAADPNADLAFDVRCEVCGHHGVAQLDAGLLLWDEVDARARALLGEVHCLACAYGWTEHDILALSPVRRASYLAMVTP
ncbi:hypothetical protein [Ralstonia solanacearum]|uniref:hypothetical protein n=1 Tax=Ralstonia solanacearum TaxID=305 RepID=UPI00078ECB93|nr:hypothetical protein [Ralstonia solanacearum]AMP37654.1 hypothetical protein LBM2029_08940 [Ralstonia solanacearum]AXV86480.1 hypothetical protein CJO78_09260 [Ralstonia solanacearum]AXW05982.1 hypothetical protein CJO82_09035 [Ralstonia solanacearum]AXW23726.1 hypothetical protein CJO86_09040 [Ralstonia solanacearum]AXW80658.1 hypothetical protein CJO98_09270 [Ralstonia solanacearum]